MLDQAGRSLALSLYLPVLALSPLLIWAIERRSKSPSAPFLILCSVLTPLLVVALRLGAVRNLLPPSPDVPQWREPLVPVMWGGVVYGLALSRRGIRARLLVVLIAAAVTLGFISVSSSWRTICDALPSSTFLRAALETLEAKLFGVGCVLLVAAAVAAWMRLRGRSGSVSAGLDAMVLAVAIPILLFSRVFPRKWDAAEIRGISLVRLEPNGDLILDAQWTQLSARPSETMPAVATLLRRSGAASQRAARSPWGSWGSGLNRGITLGRRAPQQCHYSSLTPPCPNC